MQKCRCATGSELSEAGELVWSGDIIIGKKKKYREYQSREVIRKLDEMELTLDEEDLLVAGFNQHWDNVGLLWGYVGTNGVFDGSMVLEPLHGETVSTALRFSISPFGDMGSGVIVFPTESGGEQHYVLQLK